MSFIDLPWADIAAADAGEPANRFSDAVFRRSEYIRQLLREEQKRQIRLRVEAKLDEAIASGDAVPVTGETWKDSGKRVEDRLRAAHTKRGSHGANRYAFGGDFGVDRHQPNSDVRGDVEILSDTMGVDFGPYLQRVLWERVFPVTAGQQTLKLRPFRRRGADHPTCLSAQAAMVQYRFRGEIARTAQR